MTMAEDNFVVNRKEGRQGELYAQKHLDELITSAVLSVTDTSTEKIEGKDFIASIADSETGEITDAAIEVKTIRGFLFRSNDNNEESGTIGFELWKSDKRKTPGWLLQMLKPDGKKSVRPDILMFILVAYDRVFASVTFENVSALFERLEQLSGEMDFSLHEIPVGEQATGFTIPSGLLIENMWMIPFGKLADLAHVMIIGEQPRLRPDIVTPVHSCLTVTQGARYKNLCSHAQGIIPYDNQFVFSGNKAAQVINIASKNLDVLDSLNYSHFQQLQYLNRTGTFARLWEGLYLFMLSREYPARESKGLRFYPISYSTITKWGYQNGYNKEQDTWFNCIKHLLELKLLIQYRPHKKSNNPVDIAVNKNNPHPRSVEYYSPVELTRETLLDADCEAQDYKRTRRRTSTTSKASMEIQSGPEAANRAYQDGRGLTKQLNYVWKTAEQLLIKQIDKNNYITVDDFYGKLWKEIKRSQKLKPNDNPQNAEEMKEAERFGKFWRAFVLFKKEKKDFIHQMIIYKMGLVTKQDRRWLGEIPYGTNIITYKSIPDCYMNRCIAAKRQEEEIRNAKRRKKRQAQKEKG